MMDHVGNEVDGNQIIYVIAKEYLRYNKIHGGIVDVIMTNIGIISRLQEIGAPFYSTNVGDSYIYKKMKDKQCILGLEKSGHVILLDKHSTGDGIIASFQILFVMIDRNMSLYNLWNQIKLLPQISLNVCLDYNHNSQNNIKVKNILSQSKKVLVLNSRIFFENLVLNLVFASWLKVKICNKFIKYLIMLNM